MVDPDTMLGFAFLVALILVLLGCWTLHRRVRSRSSLWLLSSIVAIAVWFPLSSLIQHFVLARFESSQSKSALNWIFVSSEVFIPALLLLAASVSFLLAVRAIEPRPNNSFKPKPLRGSA